MEQSNIDFFFYIFFGSIGLWMIARGAFIIVNGHDVYEKVECKHQDVEVEKSYDLLDGTNVYIHTCKDCKTSWKTKPMHSYRKYKSKVSSKGRV